MRTTGRRLTLATTMILLAVAAGAASASASTIIDRNATAVTLQVNSAGQARVSYTSRGAKRSVLAWGAMNALAPTETRMQGNFKLDYSGGYQTKYVLNPVVKQALASLRVLQRQMVTATAAHNNPQRYALAPRIKATYAKLARLRSAAIGFRNVCGRYTGPALPWLVTACTAPDGSSWALQSWQRMLPNLGAAPTSAAQSVWELRLSHWKGPLPVLTIHLDWVNTQKARHLFGLLSYLGKPVHGFGSTPLGVPTDSFGRNIYLDVLDAPGYGPGWKRENSFLAHNPNGNFCYAFYAHGQSPPGNGTGYRATVIGPGVLPDVSWQGTDIGSFDPADPAKVAYEQQMNTLGAQEAAGDTLCHQR